jgi:hypothetical protein
MLNKTERCCRNLLLTFSLAGLIHSAHAADTKPEEIVAKHLDSIGTAEARGAVTSRAVQGTLRFKILVGGSGESVGSWGRASDHSKSRFVMRFGHGNWRGEEFITDGEKASYAAATASHQYSDFAKFVSGQNFIVKEGWLGGELSTSWALANLDPNRGKLTYLGLKKVGGHELQTLEYVSKSGTGLSVKLYFDPETYHHVRTVYTVVAIPSGVPYGIVTSAEQQQLRFTIEEIFSDFKTENGITLPRHYDLQYTEELQSGSTHLYDWDMTADVLHDNVGLDPGNFQIK